MHNRIFIYNIIYVLIHILCYVVFITKMFEIKQNELCTHVRFIYPGLTSTALFFIRKARFCPKINLHFWTMCKIQNPPYNPGVFYISKKSALAARRGMCSTLTYHSIFNLPTTSLNHPNSHSKYQKIIRELLRRIFEKSFIFNHFQLPKIPQLSRITLKSHP